MYAIFALAAAAMLVWVEQQAGAKLHDIGKASTLTHSPARVLSKLLHGDAQDILPYLLRQPLFVVGYFLLTLWFLPYLIALVSFDMVNAQVRSQFLRFELLRTSRTNLFLGRFLAHWVLILTVTALAEFVVLGYVWSRLPNAHFIESGLLMVRYWAFTAVFSLCYLALTALVSTMVNGGVLSLVVLLIAIQFLGVLSMHQDLGFLSPAWYKFGLLSPRPHVVAINLLVFMGFAVLFLLAGWIYFDRRDL